MKHRISYILDMKQKHTGFLPLLLLVFLLLTTTFLHIGTSTAAAKDADPVTYRIPVTNNVSQPVYKEKSKKEKETKQEDKKSTGSSKKAADSSKSTDKQTVDLSEIADFAKKLLGDNYTYGGKTPEEGFDSSGLVQYVYNHFDISLKRTCASQYEQCEKIDIADLEAGDLVFYGSSHPTSGINHVAIYIGDNQVIHASNPKDGVKFSDLDYRTPKAYGRVDQSK